MTTTVNPHAFAGMLTDVVRTAGGDRSLPILNGVRLHCDMVDKRSVLVASSTDRFSLSQVHIDCSGKIPHLFLPLAEVKRVQAVLKVAGKSAELLKIRVAKGSATFDVARSVAVTVETKEHDPEKWPPVEKLFDRNYEPTTEPVWIDGSLLARFTAVAARRREPLRVHIQSPNRPVHVLIGDSFRGLVMPVRQSVSVDAPVFATRPQKVERAA